MAVKKTAHDQTLKRVSGAMEESHYTKQQILSAEKYCRQRDLLGALLEESKMYSTDEVERLIQKFMKGKVD